MRCRSPAKQRQRCWSAECAAIPAELIELLSSAISVSRGSSSSRGSRPLRNRELRRIAVRSTQRQQHGEGGGVDLEAKGQLAP